MSVLPATVDRSPPPVDLSWRTALNHRRDLARHS
jgi:hypothetical protein